MNVRLVHKARILKFWESPDPNISRPGTLGRTSSYHADRPHQGVQAIALGWSRRLIARRRALAAGRRGAHAPGVQLRGVARAAVDRRPRHDAGQEAVGHGVLRARPAYPGALWLRPGPRARSCCKAATLPMTRAGTRSSALGCSWQGKSSQGNRL